jgi:hypothetical protein
MQVRMRRRVSACSRRLEKPFHNFFSVPFFLPSFYLAESNEHLKRVIER